MGHEKGETFMSYLNSVTIIGFVGADPEQRQARNNNGSKFTVLSVATQRSWKNTDDEWASKTEWHRVCVFRPRLAEYVATTIKKGSHVLVEGSLVSTTHERNGNGRKAAALRGSGRAATALQTGSGILQCQSRTITPICRSPRCGLARDFSRCRRLASPNGTSRVLGRPLSP